VFAGQGTVAKELILYYAPIDQFNSENIEWKTLCKATDKLINGTPDNGGLPEVFGTKVYSITYKGAEKYKLIATDLKNPDWANAETVVAEKDMSLTGYTRSKDYLLLNYSDGINLHLFKFNPKTKTSTKITLPFMGIARAKCLDTKTNDFIIDITSWNKPLTEFILNVNTEKFTASPWNKPVIYPAEYNDLIVEEVEVKGHDGVMIPLSIIYKKGTKKDGSNVCFMRSYGAYGFSATPYFSTLHNTLATKGVVYAVPHVRGGGEKGEAWYKAGYKTTKPWPLGRPKQHFIKRSKPIAQRLESLPTAGKHLRLQRLCIEAPVPRHQPRTQIFKCFPLERRCRAEHLGRLHEIIVITHRIFRRRVHAGMGLRRRLRRVPLDKSPKLLLVFSGRHGGEIQQHGKRHHHIRRGYVAAVDMPDRVVQLRLDVLRGVGPQLLVIFIHRFGDHVKIHPLGGLGLETT